jgi:NADP-dependent 3-hydroxy acid dehydrogenase YdfG
MDGKLHQAESPSRFTQRSRHEQHAGPHRRQGRRHHRREQRHGRSDRTSPRGTPASFARAVAFAIEQPEDVDINEILFRPTRQEL